MTASGTVKQIALIVGIFLILWVLSKLGSIRQQKWIRQRRQEIEDYCSVLSPSETIFVSIPSYRDPECAETIFDLYQNAQCPRRIFVGLCQQNTGYDQDAVRRYEYLADRNGIGNFRDNIRCFSMSANDAKGPMYARAVIEDQLYRGEKYYLCIDSHTAFTPNWDTEFVQMLLECPSKKPILTMYPSDYSVRGKLDLAQAKKVISSFFRFKQFNPDSGLVETEGPIFQHRPSKTQPSLFWAACCSFTYGSVIEEVPFDPNCPYVFLGEEISMAARLWTHGWDFYNPTYMILHHKWSRNRPTFWEQFSGNHPEHVKRREIEEKSYKRLISLFEGGGGGLGKYGLGTSRTLRAYQEFCGVDFRRGKALKRAYLGLTKNATADEVLLKLGSLTNYFVFNRMPSQ